MLWREDDSNLRDELFVYHGTPVSDLFGLLMVSFRLLTFSFVQEDWSRIPMMKFSWPVEPNEAGLSRQFQAGANQYISRLNPGREKRTSFTLRLKHFRPCPRITLAIQLLVILLQSLLCSVHWLFYVRHYDWLHHVWFYYVRLCCQALLSGLAMSDFTTSGFTMFGLASV